MIPHSAAAVAQTLGGRVVAGDPQRVVTGVSIDTRTLTAGDAFFAIRGERQDGHQFLDAARDAGAAAVIVSEELAWPSGCAAIRVAETTLALAQLAANLRRQGGYKVVAITGSAGKTTTRALTEAALATGLKTASSVGNLNNQLGLPLSLLRLPAGIDAAVLELGMNHSGEIASLTRIADPDVGVITNVGTAHLGNFANEEQIADAKWELIDTMSSGGVGVINAETPLLASRSSRTRRRLIRFGFGPDVELRGAALGGDLFTGTRFEARGVPVQLMLWGRHAALNALAALGAGCALGLTVEAMAPALSTVAPLAGRGQRLSLRGSVLAVDETYNANPEAMEAVLAGLAANDSDARRVVVLGDMRELGARAAELHRRVGRAAALAQADVLHAVGQHANDLAAGARAAGLATIHLHDDAATAAATIPGQIEDGDLVLIKASRGTHLELVLAALIASRPVEATR